MFCLPTSVASWCCQIINIEFRVPTKGFQKIILEHYQLLKSLLSKHVVQEKRYGGGKSGILEWPRYSKDVVVIKRVFLVWLTPKPVSLSVEKKGNPWSWKKRGPSLMVQLHRGRVEAQLTRVSCNKGNHFESVCWNLWSPTSKAITIGPRSKGLLLILRLLRIWESIRPRYYGSIHHPTNNNCWSIVLLLTSSIPY